MRKTNNELSKLMGVVSAFVRRREAVFVKAMVNEGYTTTQISKLIGGRFTRVHLDKLLKIYGENETSE